MRIDTPDWVEVDRAIRESVSVDLATIVSRQVPGLSPSTTVRSIGQHPEMLQQLERAVGTRLDSGNWAARIWSVAPFPRIDAKGAFIVGWIDSHLDQPIGALVASWQRQMARQIKALMITWACLQSPVIEELVDLRSAERYTRKHGTTISTQIDGRTITVHRYQRGADPPVYGAYDPESHTLFLIE